MVMCSKLTFVCKVSNETDPNQGSILFLEKLIGDIPSSWPLKGWCLQKWAPSTAYDLTFWLRSNSMNRSCLSLFIYLIMRHSSLLSHPAYLDKYTNGLLHRMYLWISPIRLDEISQISTHIIARHVKQKLQTTCTN